MTVAVNLGVVVLKQIKVYQRRQRIKTNKSVWVAKTFVNDFLDRRSKAKLKREEFVRQGFKSKEEFKNIDDCSGDSENNKHLRLADVHSSAALSIMLSVGGWIHRTPCGRSGA